MGLLDERTPPRGLPQARQRLLALLSAAFETEPSALTVVFDARGARRRAESEQHYRGVRVLFAVRHDQADDLIEQLIRQASAPKHLVVVSDDHRLQTAARRRDCQVEGCTGFLDHLERRIARRRKKTEPPRKPTAPSHDAEYWTRQFASLDEQPEMKELFNPFDFDEPA
jgi:predicted RNA-binding protein with PIN domain